MQGEEPEKTEGTKLIEEMLEEDWSAMPMNEYIKRSTSWYTRAFELSITTLVPGLSFFFPLFLAFPFVHLCFFFFFATTVIVSFMGGRFIREGLFCLPFFF